MNLLPARPRLRAAVALVSTLAAGLALAAVTAPPAGAKPVGAHDPIGGVSSLKAVTGGAQVTGWAADPDSLKTNLTVYGVVDSHLVVSARTSLANRTATTKYRTGPTPGFRLIVPVPAGRHTLCLVGRDIGTGLNRVYRCVATPLGTKLTSAQLAAHSPNGRIAHAKAHSRTLRIRGWASDPDLTWRRSIVVLYVDNRSVATVATRAYSGSRPTGAGRLSAFDVSVPVSTGTHVGCVWVVDVGLGDNTFLGCRTRDTRGSTGAAPKSTPAINKKVLAEAKKHLHQPYVWGAVGPKKFDCSGLVLYSYGKAGFTTPRVSEDQRKAARLIPASHALPGDLVFYNDTQGDVYHVGIYVSPGKTLAAIDENHGVNWQLIWDPSATTYGSFTHG